MPTMSPHLDRGLLLYNSRRYEAAEKEFRAALAEDPDFDYAHRMLCLCLLYQRKLEMAAEEGRIAISCEPNEPFNYYSLALVLAEQRLWRQAEDAIDIAKQMEPETAVFHAEDARIAYCQSRFEEALTKIDMAVSLDPTDDAHMRLKAWILIELGKLDEADAAADDALALNPESAYGFAAKGQIMLKRKRVGPAIVNFRHALAIDPTLSWAREGLMEALRRRNPVYGVVLTLQWMGEPWSGGGISYLAFNPGLLIGGATISIIAHVVGTIMKIVGPHLLLVMMMFDPVAREALAPDELREAKLLAIWIGVSYVLGWTLIFKFALHPLFLPASALLFAMPIAFTRVFELANHPREAQFAKRYCAATAAVGVVSVVLALVGPDTSQIRNLPWNITDLSGALACIFLILAFLTRYFCREIVIPNTKNA